MKQNRTTIATRFHFNNNQVGNKEHENELHGTRSFLCHSLVLFSLSASPISVLVFARLFSAFVHLFAEVNIFFLVFFSIFVDSFVFRYASTDKLAELLFQISCRTFAELHIVALFLCCVFFALFLNFLSPIRHEETQAASSLQISLPHFSLFSLFDIFFFLLVNCALRFRHDRALSRPNAERE